MTGCVIAFLCREAESNEDQIVELSCAAWGLLSQKYNRLEK